MIIALHKNTSITHAVRAEIAASSMAATTLALRYGVSECTVYTWKGHDNFKLYSTPRTSVKPRSYRLRAYRGETSKDAAVALGLLARLYLLFNV